MLLHTHNRRFVYYIYILKNPISGLPIYVGVGKEDRQSHQPREQDHITEATRFRAGVKLKKPNRHKLNTILQILDQGYDVPVEIGLKCQSEKDAFDEEIRLIAYYGRRDLGTGILTNMSPGGEGNVEWSKESRQKLSVSKKGIPSPLKGRKVGSYSTERKQSQKEKMKTATALLTEDEKQKTYINRSNSHKGRSPWNKGKTKETDSSVAAYAASKVGKPRLDMVGKEPWNKGKKCPELGLSKLGKPAHNKGIPSGKKGKTYEEIYGVEKAAELKEKRRLKKLEFWQNQKSINS